MRECKCDMRTKLVGDGCDVCNPELAREYDLDTLRAELAAEREKVRELESDNAVLAKQNENVQDWRDNYKSACDEITILTLDNQRLREALIVLSNYAPNEVWDEYQYLSTPADTAALDAYVAEKVAALTKQLGEVSGDWLLKVYENQKLIDLIKNGEKK